MLLTEVFEDINQPISSNPGSQAHMKYMEKLVWVHFFSSIRFVELYSSCVPGHDFRQLTLVKLFAREYGTGGLPM